MDLSVDTAISRMYLSGMGTPAIGKVIGRSQCFIDAALNRQGIEKRKPGRPAGFPRPDRKTPSDVLDDAVRRYVAGESAKAIGEAVAVSKPTLLGELRRRGIEIRMQRIEIAVDPVDRYRSGTSAAELAREVGVSKKLVLRRLAHAGVDRDLKTTHVKRYKHSSPVAGVIVVRGTWELAYAAYLDSLWLSGSLRSWAYEVDQIPVGDGKHYIPDFKITSNDGRVFYHEVKGRLTDAARRKVVAARKLGHAVALIRKPVIDQVARLVGVRLAS